MKIIISLLMLTLLFACNNSNKDKQTGTENKSPVTSTTGNTTGNTTHETPAAGSASVSYTVEDAARNVRGSIIVKNDKDKLSPGNDYFAMITASGENGEHFVLNFLFALKPGTYPVVGYSFIRTKQVFGGILGGQPKLTDYKVNLTQCDDLGSNNMGGHKWKIAGSVDRDITIPAMGIMKMDSTHPAEIKVNKISFSNLSFDDNWEQILEEGMKKLKEHSN